MLLKIFKSSRPTVLFLIPVAGILLWGKAFFDPPRCGFGFDSISMPLYELIAGWLTCPSLLSVILATIFVIIQAMIVNRLNALFILTEGRSYMPALFYILISGSYAGLQRMHPALIANFFLLFAVYKILIAYRSEKAFSSFFDAALLISAGSLFYAGLIYYIILLWIGIIVLRPFNPKEWLITLIGIIIPYAPVVAYYFLTDRLAVFPETIKSSMVFTDPLTKLNIYYYILYAFLALFVFFSLLALFTGLSGKKITTRKYYLFFFWMLLISAVFVLISFITSVEIIVILAIPASYFLSFRFSTIKSAFRGELWFTLLVAAVFFIRYMN
ncbi:MAG: hypothetical protein KJ607_08585 [Bacteroidetes bacterium]|nr:hypothetical protein [Bacteroidota bacterium]